MELTWNRIKSFIYNHKIAIISALILVLLNFGIDYSLQYATDTYSTFIEKGTWVHILYENGRPLKSLIFYLFEAFNVSGGIIYHLSHFLAIVLMTTAVSYFATVIRNYISSEILCIAISFMTLGNPFVIEFWLFEEKSLFMLIILLNIIAVSVTEKMWRCEGNDKAVLYDWKVVLIIQVCLWVSVSLYQTGIFPYVVLLLPFIMIYSMNVKDFFAKNIFVAVMFGIPLGASYILAKYFLPVTRLGGDMDLNGIASTFWNIFCFVTFDDFYNVGKGIFVIWIVMLFLAVVFGIAASCKGGKVSIFKHVFAVAYIAVGCVVVSFLLYITGNSAVCWPRMIYSYGMIFGVVTIYVLYNLPRHNGRNKGISAAHLAFYLIVALTAFILIYDYIGFGKVFLERHRANQEDLYYAEIIGQRIDEYEQETGNTIDTLCYYKDHNIAVFAEGFNKTMLSERAQASGWSRHNSIEVYLDRKFTQGEPDPELEEKFTQEDWNMFSEKQLVFDGNTLHICVY